MQADSRQAVIGDIAHAEWGTNAIVVAVSSTDIGHNTVHSLALAVVAVVPVRPALSVSGTRLQRMPYWEQLLVVRYFGNRHKRKGGLSSGDLLTGRST